VGRGVLHIVYPWDVGVIAWIRFIVTMLIMGGVLLASVIAIIDAARIPASNFVDSGKHTKRFWLLLLGAGVLFAVLGALQMVGIMLNIIAIIPAAAYWYGVRSEVKPYRAKTVRAKTPMARPNFKFGRNTAKVIPFSPLDSRAAGNPNDPRFDV